MAEIMLNVPLSVDEYRRADSFAMAKGSTLFEEVQRFVREYTEEYDTDGPVLGGADTLDHMNAIITAAQRGA